jgi:hypothetical protein
MRVHLIIPDLFLPSDFAAEACADLQLPSLEKILSRGRLDRLHEAGLEEVLCEAFGVPHDSGVPVARISALFDGLGEGCWLRADPVCLRLHRDQLVLLPNVEASETEAGQLCASLNKHFAGQGMEFVAPHPLRWYVRLDHLPNIETVPLSQAVGRNVHDLLPKGAESLRWHRLFNETQMLLFSHPVNEAREARGDLPVNSLWFWGGGCDTLLMKPLAIRLGEQNALAKSLVMAKPADCGSSREVALCVSQDHNALYKGDNGCSPAAALQRFYDSVSSDDVLAEMFAAAANIPFLGWREQWRKEEGIGSQLLVWTKLRSALQRGDLSDWRAALQEFEAGYARPLWRALRSGRVTQLQLDVLGGASVRRLSLKRADAWAFWRPSRPLAGYSVV